MRLRLLALYSISNLALLLLYEVGARWQSALCKRCHILPSCFGFFQVAEGFWLVCFLINSRFHIKLILYSFPLFSPPPTLNKTKNPFLWFKINAKQIVTGATVWATLWQSLNIWWNGLVLAMAAATVSPTAWEMFTSSSLYHLITNTSILLADAWAYFHWLTTKQNKTLKFIH